MGNSDTKVSAVTAAHPLITTIPHVGNIIEQDLDKALEAIDLSFTQLTALHNIHQNKKLPLSELAQRKECVKSNITQLVDRMESKGMVKRKRSEKDRRKVLVLLTAEGEQRYQEGIELLHKAETEILSRLSGRQQKLLNELLHLIIND